MDDLKSAVTTLRPGRAHLQAEVEVVAVDRPSDSSKRTLRTAHGDSTSRKPSTVSTSPVRA